MICSVHAQQKHYICTQLHVYISKIFLSLFYNDITLCSEWSLDVERLFFLGSQECPKQIRSWPACCLCSDGRKMSSEMERLLKKPFCFALNLRNAFSAQPFYIFFLFLPAAHSTLIPTSEISYPIQTQELRFPSTRYTLTLVADTWSLIRPHHVLIIAFSSSHPHHVEIQKSHSCAVKQHYSPIDDTSVLFCSLEDTPCPSDLLCVFSLHLPAHF